MHGQATAAVLEGHLGPDQETLGVEGSGTSNLWSKDPAELARQGAAGAFHGVLSGQGVLLDSNLMRREEGVRYSGGVHTHNSHGVVEASGFDYQSLSHARVSSISDGMAFQGTVQHIQNGQGLGRDEADLHMQVQVEGVPARAHVPGGMGVNIYNVVGVPLLGMGIPIRHGDGVRTQPGNGAPVEQGAEIRIGQGDTAGIRREDDLHAHQGVDSQVQYQDGGAQIQRGGGDFSQQEGGMEPQRDGSLQPHGMGLEMQGGIHRLAPPSPSPSQSSYTHAHAKGGGGVKTPRQKSQGSGDAECGACAGRHRKHNCGRERVSAEPDMDDPRKDPNCLACQGRHRCVCDFPVLACPLSWERRGFCEA